ncbi:hypothetical protein ACFU6I_42575 [Streptomyces sp. NPDC057486]|uniref:hypothetical protein n=1 Tax=Streptomyces sp. NPDC057486 TaxID=3346145 RepID=UPI0036BF6DA9
MAAPVGASHDVEEARHEVACGRGTSLQVGGAIDIALVAAVRSGAHAPVEHGQLTPGEEDRSHLTRPRFPLLSPDTDR